MSIKGVTSSPSLNPEGSRDSMETGDTSHSILGKSKKRSATITSNGSPHVTFKLGFGDGEASLLLPSKMRNGSGGNVAIEEDTHIESNQNDLTKEEFNKLAEEQTPTNLDLPTIASQSTLSIASDQVKLQDPSFFYHDVNPEISVKEVLVELFELKDRSDLPGRGYWEETARWMKYEEDVEGVNQRWGQPHVPFLSYHSIGQLGKTLSKGSFHFDVPVTNYVELCNIIAEAVVTDDENKHQKEMRMNAINELLLLNHLSVNRKISRTHTANESILSSLSLSSLSRFRSSTHLHNDKINVLSGKASFPNIKLHHENNEQAHLVPQTSDNSNVISENRSFPNVRDIGNVNKELIESNARNRQSVINLYQGVRSDKLVSKEKKQYEIDQMFKILPEGAEAAQVLVGCVPLLTKVRFVMIRLNHPTNIKELTENKLPLRFLFVILGPALDQGDYHELGRTISSLMANKNFRRVAYAAYHKSELIDALDYFLKQSTIIPPGEIDSKSSLWNNEIKRYLKKQRMEAEIHDNKNSRTVTVLNAKDNEFGGKRKNGGDLEAHEHQLQNSNNGKITKSGFSLFKGLRADITQRIKYYSSDYKDALNFQCFTSIIFMFFASFAPAITFGGLMGQYTGDRMGTIETLLAQCICGIIWGLFSAQPLLIMSATGPVLLFEAALANFCAYAHLDFLTIRLYAGFFIMIISIVLVGLEGSRLLHYVTRFTEDIFATLISVIFISESIRFVIKTFEMNPVENYAYYQILHQKCDDVIGPNHGNMTEFEQFGRSDVEVHIKRICIERSEAEPNTALLTAIVMFGTFIVAFFLKKLRESFYLGRQARRIFGDFGVLISIVIVSACVQMFTPDPYIKNLEMPDHLNFTNTTARGHGVFVSPYMDQDHIVFGVTVAFVVALLVFILLFVETEITELLLDRKERKLRKGSGRNWDLVLVGICAFLCSIFGMPWMCAAAVQSLAHCSSLTVMKKQVPGARAEVDYVIEQRVTTIGVSILIGLVTFLGSLLKLPIATLFGVFMYLGIMNLAGVQLIHRMILFFIPEKYMPVKPYTENVKLKRMHLFTIIQIICLVFIYFVKSQKKIALAFPFVLILFILIRQFLIPLIFDEKEIKALDGEDEHEDDEWMEKDFYENVPIPV
uniref:Anion exchange protein n=1 Tax=Rhabditophanes sp. KR3021 TaxID=114890 RepID=A0AC35U7A9_9BILA